MRVIEESEEQAGLRHDEGLLDVRQWRGKAHLHRGEMIFSDVERNQRIQPGHIEASEEEKCLCSQQVK